MFTNFFSKSPRLSTVAQFCVDLVNENRFEALGRRKGNEIPKVLSVVYATHAEFIGSVIGIIDFGKQTIDDPTPHKEITRQVMQALFGDNANKASMTAANGIDNPPLMLAFEQVVEHLEWATKLPGSQTAEELRFLIKYF